MTGRYQNKSSEAGIRFKRQALPDLPTQSTQAALNGSTVSPISHSTGLTLTAASTLPIHSSSSASAITSEAAISSSEPKNATSGGGVDPLAQSSNSTQLVESSSAQPQHSSAFIPLNPSSPIALNSSPVSGAPIGSNSSPLSNLPELSTQEHTSPKLSESSPPPSQQQALNGSVPESSSLKPAEPISGSHLLGTTLHSASGTTTEIEYEYSGSSGGSSSEVGAAKPLQPKGSSGEVAASKPLQPSNPIVDTLNQQHNNISEPAGPPAENSTKLNIVGETTIIPLSSSSQTTIHSPGSAPGAKAPGTKQSGQRPLKPQQASDIDANAADQDNNQQRVKIEVLREARRRLSEFKGCMARARIKREECKPLVRCCPDTAV